MARNPQNIATISAAKAWLKKHGVVSERALATAFAETYDSPSQWRYNWEEGMWLQWNGKYWARHQGAEIMEAIGNLAMKFALIFHRLGDISKAEATRLKSRRTVSGIEQICRSLPSFLARSVLFDSDPFLLGTPGGTVDLRTGEMWLPEPEDFITVLAPVTPAPIGTPLGPKFKKFLDDITGGDRDFQRTLQMWFGISASGTARDQRILFLYGAGGNGKGVLLRTVAGLLGEHAITAPRDLLMMDKYSRHGTHLIDVARARMAIATEIDDDAVWDVGLMKDITGGDPIHVNRMRQDPFRVTPRCSITISGNRKPALKEVDAAVQRRFMMATFAAKVKAEDVIPDLEKIFIAEEGPAILRWVIDGAVDREKSGALFVADIITNDTEDYLAEEDLMTDFIAANYRSDPSGRVTTAESYGDWKVFCEQFGRKSGSRNGFTTQMKAAGVTYERTKHGRYFVGISRAGAVY